MKILTRYISSELLKWFLLSLTVLTLIILIFFVSREAIRHGLPPAQVVRLIPYFLPIALWIAVPGTLLLAATSVYGRLSGWNEVVAAKAQGISPRKLLEPIWVLAFFMSLVTVYLNDLAVSWGRVGAENLLIKSVEDIAYGMLRTQTTFTTGSLEINVRQVVGRRLLNPHIRVKGKGLASDVTIVADEVELKTDHERNELILALLNPTFDTQAGVSAQFPNERFEYRIPLPDAKSVGDMSPSQLELRVIPAEIVRQKAKIEQREKDLAAKAACQMLTGDLGALTGNEWEIHSRLLRIDRERLCRLRAEPHRRWSAGFSCLCFAWVGAPLAIRLRNRDVLTSFFLCFLPILIVYYPLLVFGVDAAKVGRLPPWSVWLGNLLLIAWGFYLLRKVIRY
ncbi:MAG: YjgP/YjgQ family permease [Pirellulaceae bacterium]|nr:YjgP/YjgQ family permease [Pirellulaceae bacterium]